MPVKDDGAVNGIQRSTHAQPLVVQDDEGASVLVLFTSPERAKPFLEHYPDFKGGLLTEFTWILEKMDEGFGIMINPGDELGIDREPELVQQRLKAQRTPIKRSTLPAPKPHQAHMPGNIPFIPRIIFPIPPFEKVFIIFCICSN